MRVRRGRRDRKQAAIFFYVTQVHSKCREQVEAFSIRQASVIDRRNLEGTADSIADDSKCFQLNVRFGDQQQLRCFVPVEFRVREELPRHLQWIAGLPMSSIKVDKQASGISTEPGLQPMPESGPHRLVS